MRAAAILGLGSSIKSLKPFQHFSDIDWQLGLPADPGDAEAVLIFGGDGTVHRHLAPLVRLGRPVLVVPCGSGNDFARALGLRNRGASLEAWKRFVSQGSNVRTIDVGVISEIAEGRSPGSQGEAHDSRSTGQHYFCCIAGVGIDAEVARRANALPRWLRGHGGYVLS